MNRKNYVDMMEVVIEELGTKVIKKDPVKSDPVAEKSDEVIKKGKWPTWNKAIKQNFTPNTSVIFGKLKDYKNPYKNE